MKLGSKQDTESWIYTMFCSEAAVLDVHKLQSFLPHRDSPNVTQTSYGVWLVSSLYISKQSAEHITARSELEITTPISSFCACDRN